MEGGRKEDAVCSLPLSFVLSGLLFSVGVLPKKQGVMLLDTFFWQIPLCLSPHLHMIISNDDGRLGISFSKSKQDFHPISQRLSAAALFFGKFAIRLPHFEASEIEGRTGAAAARDACVLAVVQISSFERRRRRRRTRRWRLCPPGSGRG